jgi:hypothetical protein
MLDDACEGQVNLTFEVVGIDKLIAKYGQGADPIIKALTRGIAEDIRERIAVYPGPVQYPVEWVSEAQRRAYFAKRKGLGPYTRQSDSWSERLGPSWATENRGIDAVVGTTVSYARWVQSKEHQQPMHKNTGWVTDEDAIEGAQRDNVAERVMEEVLSGW